MVWSSLEAGSDRQQHITIGRLNMGPHRIINNRRGYLTETYYDAENRRFSERPFPPTVRMEPPKASSATAEPKPALQETDLPGLTRVFVGTAKQK